MKRDKRFDHRRVTMALFSAVTILLIIGILATTPVYFLKLNRPPAAMPKVTEAGLMDGSFMEQTEQAFIDRLPFREQWTALYTTLMLAQGQREVNGVYVGQDRLVEVLPPEAPNARDTAADAINVITELGNDVSIMVVPTAAEIYPKEMPYLADSLDQADYIRGFYSELKRVNCIDVVAPLATETDNQLFYRTDHHWTSYGAYVGYKAMASTLGFRAATYDMFNIEHASYKFRGSLYEKTLYDSSTIRPDVIDLYSFAKGESVVGVERRYEGIGDNAGLFISRPSVSIFERDWLNPEVAGYSYNTFGSDGQSITNVFTSVQNGKRLLILKDSFADALLQFLPIHYNQITTVDMSLITDGVAGDIDITSYDQILIVCSIQSLMRGDVTPIEQFGNTTSAKQRNP